MQTGFHMIDVGEKSPTRRLAVATGSIAVGEKAFALIESRALPKGDALAMAEIAGITGAKKAYEMLPLCHPLGLDHVRVITELDAEHASIHAYCIASAHAKTGVEMEALAGVNAALLAIYDLTKMVEPALAISGVRLLLKLGGKKGLWLHPDGAPDWVMEVAIGKKTANLGGISCAIVTMSDRASRGEYEDISGALLKETIGQAGGSVVHYEVIPDEYDRITHTLSGICDVTHPALLIATGGTGVASRDVTPEAIENICQRIVPGIGELLRANGARFTPHSWSSRAIAGIRGSTLIIALPGSPKAVREGMECLLPLLPHLIATIRGEKHDRIQRSA